MAKGKGKPKMPMFGKGKGKTPADMKAMPPGKSARNKRLAKAKV